MRELLNKHNISNVIANHSTDMDWEYKHYIGYKEQWKKLIEGDFGKKIW